MSHRLRFGVVVASLVLVPIAAAAQAPPLGCPGEFEWRVVDLVNEERSARGLAPLTIDVRLMEAAQLHAVDMAIHNFLSHTGSGGSTMTSRIEAVGYRPWLKLAENVAAGYTTPESVVSGWMASSGHRTNILDPLLVDIGVGYAYASGTQYRHYWAQDFGRMTGPLASPLEHCPVCSNGEDDDGDGAIDFPADLQCADPNAARESPAQCDDGVDNDGDGRIDWDGGGRGAPDPQCNGDPMRTERAVCGLGAELALVMPLLGLAASRRRRAAN